MSQLFTLANLYSKYKSNCLDIDIIEVITTFSSYNTDLNDFKALYDTILEFDSRLGLEPTLNALQQEVFLSSDLIAKKNVGAYYTPSDLASFMSVSTIENQLSQGKLPMDLKIIDNSCGSGQFLIECLNYLTERTYKDLDTFPKEKEVVESELSKVQNIDKQLILKRILAKRCIYGIDIMSIAVEITILSIWLLTYAKDLPLIFIEHHIKCGDALLGFANKEEVLKVLGKLVNINKDKLKQGSLF